MSYKSQKQAFERAQFHLKRMGYELDMSGRAKDFLPAVTEHKFGGSVSVKLKYRPILGTNKLIIVREEKVTAMPMLRQLFVTDAEGKGIDFKFIYEDADKEIIAFINK